MADNKAIITSTTPAGATVQKTITGISPYATNELIASLGSALNDFTDNTYGKTEKVTKVNCDAEGGGGKLVPTFTVTTDNDAPIVDGGTYNLHSGSYLDVTNDGDATVFLSIEPGNGNESFGRLFGKNPQNPKWVINYSSGTYTVIILAPETENYQAAQISFTAVFS